jgi:hypothetical protein
MRWNLRTKVERAVPRPDGTVLDSLEELTARIRAVARSLPDIGAADGAGQNLASFGQDYAVTLRNLADPVRQLADLRSSLPGAALAAASDGQHQLEREAAQLPGHSDARSTAAPRPAYQRDHQRARGTPSGPLAAGRRREWRAAGQRVDAWRSVRGIVGAGLFP